MLILFWTTTKPTSLALKKIIVFFISSTPHHSQGMKCISDSSQVWQHLLTGAGLPGRLWEHWQEVWSRQLPCGGIRRALNMDRCWPQLLQNGFSPKALWGILSSGGLSEWPNVVTSLRSRQEGSCHKSFSYKIMFRLFMFWTFHIIYN